MKDLFWWLISLLFAMTIFATEVYNCKWSQEGEYYCERISSDKPKELTIDTYVFDPTKTSQDDEFDYQSEQ